MHIKNYRLFEDFRMEGLAQVNLIAGKNNTGKTAVLEALRILESQGDNTVINNIIKERGQFILSRDSCYGTLFNRQVFYDENPEYELEIVLNKLKIIRLPNLDRRNDEYIEMDYRIEFSDVQGSILLSANITPDFPQDKSVFIPLSNNEILIPGLWKKVTLTPRKKDLIKILKTIDPAIVDLDVQQDGAMVLLDGEEYPVALKNLGDGVNRVLVLGLALVNAKGKVLLIDEFEVGLHHSVQEQLWEIIFEYAKKWDIQVFATTHSMDTVRSFYYVMSDEKNKGMGKYFRLQQSRKGPIEAVSYKEEDLELSLDVNLEPRG